MKWEYKTIKLAPQSFFVEKTPSFESLEIDKFINQLGQDGWELVSTVDIINSDLVTPPITKSVILFFKRPLAE